MMESKAINKKLLETVPGTANLFESITSWQDGLNTGSTIVVEDVFMKYLEEALASKDIKAVQDCTKFIEWLSDYYEDEYAGTVLVIGIFENIHFSANKEILETALGPKAKSKYFKIDW